MDNQQPEKMATWALVEVMGHTRLAGFVTEQQLGGTAFVRVDVPSISAPPYYGAEPVEVPGFTKLLGAAAIFSLTPCDEGTARRAAAAFANVPFASFKAPEVPQLAGPPAERFDPNQDEDEDD